MLVKAIVIVVLAVLFGPLLKAIWDLMDWHLHFHKHHPGKCSVVKRPGAGSEDFQILSSGLTFVTSGMFFNGAPPIIKSFVKAKGKGSIQMVDLSLPVSEAKVLKIKHGKDFNPDTFRPHGLSVLEDKVKNEHLLYVINHAEDQDDRVEKFRYFPKTKELQHVKSMVDDLLRTTNDLTVLADDRFYIANWLYFGGEHASLLEQLYALPLGNVLFYNGTGFTVVKDRLAAPNSPIVSKDGRYLYLSLPNAKTVQVYKRESDYNLRLVQEVIVHTGLDNFVWSEDGRSLYGGCHPIKHKATKHFLNPAEEIAPSQVIRLPLKDGLIVENEITQEFYDHGDLISGSSVAGVFKNKLMIGSVLDKLVMCQLPVKP